MATPASYSAFNLDRDIETIYAEVSNLFSEHRDVDRRTGLPITLASTAAVTRDRHIAATQTKAEDMILSLAAKGYGTVNLYQAGMRTSNTASANTAILDALISGSPAGTTLYLPPGTYPLAGCTFSNVSNLALVGKGTFALSGTTTGISLEGTLSNLTFEGFTIQGDGQVASDQFGIASVGSVVASNIRTLGVNVLGTTLGVVYFATTGSFVDSVVGWCYIDNIVGTASGAGYGINFTNAAITTDANLLSIGNVIRRVQRHSIYDAQGFGHTHIGNRVDLHRTGITDTSERPACLSGRGGRRAWIGNRISRHNSTAMFFDNGDQTVAHTLYGTIATGNIIEGGTGITPDVSIGESLTTPVATLGDLLFQGNVVRNNGSTVPSCLRWNFGQRVDVLDNTFIREGVTAAVHGWEIQGRGESGGSATFSERWRAKGNRIRITDGGGGSSSAGVRFNPPFNNDSSIDFFLDDNEIIAPNKYSTSATITNVNLSIRERARPIDANDFTLVSGWGTGATFTVVLGSNTHEFTVAVTAGTSPGTNPILRLTYPDGARLLTPHASMQMVATTAAVVNAVIIDVASNLSQADYRPQFTPVATETYTFTGSLFG